MTKLLFATTNKDKIKEANLVLGLEVEEIRLEVDEIQSLDPIVVAVKKAQAYYNKIRRPLFVEDVSLSFAALKNLPGTYIDSFLKAIDNKGLIELLKNTSNRKATAQTTLVYIAKDVKPQIFIGTTKGTISKKEKGKGGFGWDKVFIPEGSNKTFAEMTLEEKTKYSMRRKALVRFKKYLDQQ